MEWNDDVKVRQEELDALEYQKYPGIMGGLNEITQSVRYRFQLLTNEGLGAHQWCLCRDYIHDMFRTAFVGINTAIYGMYYKTEDYNERPIATDMFLVAVKGIATKAAAECSLKLLNHYERIGGFPLSVMSKKKTYYVFMGSSDWLQGAALISFYTFLIRLGSYYKYHELGKFHTDADLHSIYGSLCNNGDIDMDNDIQYLKSTYPRFNKVMEEADHIFDGEWELSKKTEKYIYHDDAGIVALCEEYYNMESVNYEEVYFNQRAYDIVHGLN